MNTQLAGDKVVVKCRTRCLVPKSICFCTPPLCLGGLSRMHKKEQTQPLPSGGGGEQGVTVCQRGKPCVNIATVIAILYNINILR